MALPGWYSLTSVVEIHATLEGLAVAFFVALVVFDVLAHLNKRRELVFERIALICFGVAVLAEVCAYPYSRRIDTLSSEANAELNKEAGDARKDAGDAIDRTRNLEASNKQLGLDLESEKQKTARFQKEADIARLALERNAALASARYLLMDQGKEQFLKATTPFGGQKVELQTCRGLEKDNEAGVLFQSILELLSSAKWDIHSSVWQTCGNGFGRTGVMVSVNMKSSPSTMASAEAVSIVLEKLLWGDFDEKEFNALLKIRASPDFAQKPWGWISPVYERDPPLSAETVRILILGHQPR